MTTPSAPTGAVRSIAELVPERLLLGPGPSQCDPEVVRALASPPISHLDPAMLGLLGDVQEMLRYAFNTRNSLTLAVSGTGTAGMEAALANSIQPGDRVVVGVMGYFGERLCEIAARMGGEVTRVEAKWGRAIDPQAMRDAIKRVSPQVVCTVHAETSTGVRQELAGISEAAHEVDALFVVDAVTSLGGEPLMVDEWGIDVCYSGSQKCLGAPSGMAPLTLGERAVERLRARSERVGTFYLDALLLSAYWNDRQYHHTISAPLIYALHTALRLLREEGLEARWARHQEVHERFREAVEGLGMRYLPEREVSLRPLNALLVPEGGEEAALRSALLERYGIEVGGGMGPMRGKLVRVGLMGYGAQHRFAERLVEALKEVLPAW